MTKREPQSVKRLDARRQVSAFRVNPGRVHMAWTAGLWVRLFNAKKDAADGGGPQLNRLATEVAERLARAGLDSGA